MTELSVSRWAKANPEGLAFVHPHGSLTWAELAEAIRPWCATFEKAKRPVVLQADLSWTSLLKLFALLSMGCPFLPMHEQASSHDWEEALRLQNEPPEPLPSDAQVIVMTSGTTGRPKPALLTRSHLLASAKASALAVPLVPGDAWLLSMTPARIGGLSVITRSLYAGSTVVVDKFSPATFPGLVDTHHLTHVSVVPTMLKQVLDAHPDWQVPAFVKGILVGGAALEPELYEEAVRRGAPIIQTYGMTETASHVVTTPYEERYRQHRGVGRVHQGVTLRLVDGEIALAGPMVSGLYWGQGMPKTRDGFFFTGDVGHFDERAELVIDARKSEMFVSGGHNIYPQEIERQLKSCHGIQDALVVGMPDATWGAVVCALLVKSELNWDFEAFQTEVLEKLAAYKAPRRVAWVDRIPETNAGKRRRTPDVLHAYTLEALHWRRR